MKRSEGPWQVERPDFDNAIDFALADRRIVLLHGEIDSGQSSEATRDLLYLSSKSSEPIKIILNSVGGDVYDGLLVFDTIRDLIENHGIDVTVETRGLCASMAVIILQAASPGRRQASRYTRLLIHEVSSFSAGKSSEQEEQVAELRKVNAMLRDILAERTGKSPDDIERIWRKTDVWFGAEEAKAFGLIDKVV